MSRLLTLDQVSIEFGGLKAVNKLNFHVDEGELIGLIGPNGAGKTTVFNLVTGVYRRPPDASLFAIRRCTGRNLTGSRPMGSREPFRISASSIR